MPVEVAIVVFVVAWAGTHQVPPLPLLQLRLFLLRLGWIGAF